MNQSNNLQALLQRLVANEIAAWRAIYQGPAAELATPLGIGYAEESGALQIWNRTAPVLLFNRLIGLGMFAEATEAVIDVMLARMRAAKAPAQIQLMPPAPPKLATMLAERGFAPTASWLVHYRTLDGDLPNVATPGYRIERLTPANAAIWSDALMAAWGFAPRVVTGALALTIPMAQNPAFVCIAAINEASGQIVGGGVLYAFGGVAGLYADGVRAEHREHGLHDALIAARLAEGRRIGCDLAYCQTLASHPAEHNMQQAGFSVACEQSNFVTPKKRE
jgi:hypothetical protein